MSTMRSLVPQSGLARTRFGSAGVNSPNTAWPPTISAEHEHDREHDAADSPALQRDRSARGRERTELRNEVASVLLHDRAQLRRARDTASRGERLGDLVRREVPQRMLVDPIGIGLHREDEHHVREVDRLSPRRRAHLCERDVDEEQVAVLHHQVRRLDVAVREPVVPQLPDEREALVDDDVVDLDVADLVRAVEELRDEQVFALGRELDDARRVRRSGPRSPASAAACSPRTGRAAAPTGTALRPRAVRRGSSGRACTSGRRARGSSRRASRTGTCPDRRDVQPQRGRAARAREPDGLHVEHGDAELVLDRLTDRVAPAAARRRGARSCPAVRRPGRPRSV